MTDRLIADGGSTKIHWVRIDGAGRVCGEFFTTGVNPAVTDAGSIARIFRRELTGRIPETTGRVEFYGAGCKGEEACGAVRDALRLVAGEGVELFVESDMLGACRCVLDERPGVMCILGTGANSCLYDGRMIVANVSPGGYILGDEGSGAWIGRSIAGDYIKGLMPVGLCRAFENETGLDGGEIIRRVYRPGEGDDAPNRFLASLAPFAGRHIGEEYVREVVTRGFREFFRRNVSAYHPIPGPGAAEVNFAGSVAKVFEPLLREVAAEEGYVTGIVARNPIEALTGRIKAVE